MLPYAIPSMAPGLVAIKNGLRGPNYSISSACASGTHAIAEAAKQIRNGEADVMLTGGAESGICPLAMTCFSRIRALSTRNDDPSVASRPFDLNRDGFVMGEGSGILVLENWEHARQRGADILAELVGHGQTADAYHITKPACEGNGLADAIRLAMASGNVSADRVDYINAHGTSTPLNDKLESQAIRASLGSHAERLSISSTKGVTGHCLGAAGGIEAVYTVLAIRHGLIPPTANLTTPDPECPLDYTPLAPKEREIDVALSNSSGFGGQNACLAFGKFR